jgi:putative tryptophan/tyrosine transport system substrate-binding protein
LIVGLKRRVLIAAAIAAIPGAAAGQAPKKIVVGLLSWWPASMEPIYAARLREGLRAYGYVEGRNLELLTAFTDGDVERTRKAAKDFADRGVDVMVVTATPAVAIAKQVTEGSNIAIVMAPVADPIAPGFAASIARPGGRLTGMSMVGPDLSGKRLALLRELMPDLKSVAFVGSSRDPNTKTFVAGIEQAAAQLGIKLTVKLVDTPSEIGEPLMAALKQQGVQAVVVQPIFIGHQDRIVAAARSARLPVVSDFPVFAVAGGLFTYGIDDRARMERAAYFVDRIAKGSSPADLPIELPTDYALVINPKAAAAFGLTVPPTVLYGATEVVE